VDVKSANDVVGVVLEQHEAAKRGLTEVSNAAGDHRSATFGSLAGVLAAHEGAEEAVIYPALRKLGDEGAKVADARAAEEAVAKENLTKLKGMDSRSAEFGQMFETFKAAVMEHASKEEAEVIPLLNASFTDAEREAMGDAFIAAQDPAAGNS
jgi:hemerythrin superfamily protein